MSDTLPTEYVDDEQAAPTEEPKRVDAIQYLKDALPEAHAVSLEQAYLRGQSDQAALDAMPKTPGLGALSAAFDNVVQKAAAIEPMLVALPEPYRTILVEAIEAAKVVDKALAPHGL